MVSLYILTFKNSIKQELGFESFASKNAHFYLPFCQFTSSNSWHRRRDEWLLLQMKHFQALGSKCTCDNGHEVRHLGAYAYLKRLPENERSTQLAAAISKRPPIHLTDRRCVDTLEMFTSNTSKRSKCHWQWACTASCAFHGWWADKLFQQTGWRGMKWGQNLSLI